MATVTVTAANTNTRVTASDSATSWGNWGSTGPSPAAEASYAYQGTNAVNKQITSTTLGGIDYDPGSGAVDVSTTPQLWLAKVIVADAFDVNTTRGVVVAAGSANNAYRAWVLAGSATTNPAFATYNPAQGGYIIVAITPAVTFWHDGTVSSGSPSWTAVDWFGVQCAMVNGNAKSENLAMDAIDIGTGLQLYGGDGGDADGTYLSFVTTDQGNSSNRWGYASSSFGIVFLRGMMEVGVNNVTSTATEFTSVDEVVVFPDMFIDSGMVGTTFDLGSASTAVTLSSTIIGRGGLYNSGAIDTRPDMIFTGTSGSATVGGSVTGHRNITLTSAVDVDAATLGCVLLTQSGAHVRNTTIVTDQVANTATIQDPTFGSTSGLHDIDFVQDGSGHAIEIDTAASYDLNNITFTGYNGSDGQSDSAIFVNLASGSVTLNVIGGDTPTYRLPGGSTATVTIVANPVTLLVNVIDSGTLADVQNARVYVEADSGGPETAGTVLINDLTDVNGQASDTRTYASDQPITGWVRRATAGFGTVYKEAAIVGTIDSNTGLTITTQLIPDE